MKYKRLLFKFIINHFLCSTHFFNLKRKLLISCGIQVGKNTKIVGPLYFGNVVNIKIGDNCWIGKNLSIDGNGYVEIGDNVDIAPHVVISTGGHKIGLSTHRAGEGVINSIKIGNGCWIGTRCLIVNNSNVGSGVVVAAGSVIINNLSNNVLVAGIPAIVKRRLNDD